MAGVGKFLRQAREKQNYTLNEMTELTNIDIKYLQALEAEEYEILPSSFYVRTFIRTYAKYLNLNVNSVIQLYESSQQPKPTSTIPKLEIMEDLPRRSTPVKKRVSSLWLIVAILLILGIIYMVFQ